MAPILLFITGVLAGLIAGLGSSRVFRARGRVELIENLQSERGDLQNQLVWQRQQLHLAEKVKDTALLKADEDIQNFRRKSELLNRDLVESKESAAKSRTIIENLQSERGDLQNYLDSLQSQLSQRPVWGSDPTERAVEFPGYKGDDLLQRMVNVLRDRASQQTPRQILEMVASLSNGSLVLLPSALKSADESSDFELGNKLFDLLWKLATEYRQLRLQGGPDKLSMQVFGHNVWAARESEKTENSAKSERTFVYKGQPKLMQQHLKIGVKDSTNCTLRLHFVWDPEDGVVVIGHCGPHLFVPGR